MIKIITIFQRVLIFEQSVNHRRGPRSWPQIGAAATWQGSPFPPTFSEIKLVFSIPPHRPTPNFPASWSAAPTDLLPVVRYDRKAGERSLDLLRWGPIP